MLWHRADFSSLLQHLPHSLGDLRHHENKGLVKSAAAGFSARAPKEEEKHRLILHEAPSGASPAVISIEKDIDAVVSRSQHNIDLLIRDYLHTLPVYTPKSREAEMLLEHWRTILLEQPERLAEAKTNFWNSEKAKEFWQERVRRIRPDHVIYTDDWEHASGVPTPHPAMLGALKAKQWQDLVIRQRLHNQTSFFESLG